MPAAGPSPHAGRPEARSTGPEQIRVKTRAFPSRARPGPARPGPRPAQRGRAPPGRVCGRGLLTESGGEIRSSRAGPGWTGPGRTGPGWTGPGRAGANGVGQAPDPVEGAEDQLQLADVVRQLRAPPRPARQPHVEQHVPAGATRRPGGGGSARRAPGRQDEAGGGPRGRRRVLACVLS
jgi:hypothetical protein